MHNFYKLILCRVVRKILNIYPEAMLMKDKSLNLPLHIACKFDRLEIVKELLMTEVEEQGRKGRLRANKLQRLARELLEERCIYVNM